MGNRVMIISTHSKFKTVIKDIREKHVSAFAAQVSFYFIMSLFPMMILVFSMLYFFEITPGEMHDVSGNSILKFYKLIPETPIISFSTFLAAWSSGKTFVALRESFRYMMGKHSSSGYIRMRVRGVGVSVIFSMLISLIVLISIFGTAITDIILSNHQQYVEYSDIIQLIRKMFIVISLFLILFAIYRFLPEWDINNKNQKIIPKYKNIVIMAALVSAVIYAYTVFFSIYTTKYSNMNLIYYDAKTLVSFMILTYGVIFVLITGFRLLVFRLYNHF
ncbi:MAG: YihY/virulence factor BrkB family protein [Ruminococcaceae bacterium]|nr:YihY/virulence factor BrkB family protein [Oscillospiraceae bacterium]